MAEFIKVSPDDMGEGDIQAVYVNPTHIISMVQFSEGTGIYTVNSHIATRMTVSDLLAQLGGQSAPQQPREVADEIPPSILNSFIDKDDEGDE